MDDKIPQKIDTAKLQKLLGEAFWQISPAKDQDVILVLGNTSAGKSTTINFLMGSQFELDETAELRLKKGEKSHVKVGNKILSSETLFASTTTKGPHGFTYCDCPGFEDTRKNEEGIISALGPYFAIKHAKSIRAVLVVIDYRSIGSSRGAQFKKLSEMVNNLLPNLTSLAETTPIIHLITHVSDTKEQVEAMFRKIQKEALVGLNTCEERNQLAEMSSVYSMSSMILKFKKMILLNKTHMVDFEKSKAIINNIKGFVEASDISISKNCFNIHNDKSDAMSKLRDSVFDTVRQANECIFTLSELPVEKYKSDLSKAKSSKGYLEEQLRNLQSGTNQTIENLTRIIADNAKSIQENEKLIQEIQSKKQNKEGTLSNLDNDIEIQHWTENFNEQCPSWYGYVEKAGTFFEVVGKILPGPWGDAEGQAVSAFFKSQCFVQKEFLYNGIRYVKRDENPKMKYKGTFENERYNGAHGHYEGTYKSQPYKDGEASVTIYVAKKDLYREEIENLKKEIKFFENEVARLTQGIEKWKKESTYYEQKKEGSLNTENPNNLKEKIGAHEIEINELTQKISDAEKSIKEAKVKLVQRKPQIAILRAIESIISFEGLQSHEFFTKFCQICKKHDLETIFDYLNEIGEQAVNKATDIYLVGTFNHWTPSPFWQIKSDGRLKTDRFNDIGGLSEHQYKYLVDKKWVPDDGAATNKTLKSPLKMS